MEHDMHGDWLVVSRQKCFTFNAKDTIKKGNLNPINNEFNSLSNFNVGSNHVGDPQIWCKIMQIHHHAPTYLN